MATPTPPPSDPGRDGLGPERRNKPGRGLTAQERRAFEEIEQRLRNELDPGRRRRAPIVWSALIAVGSIVGVLGLVLVDSVVIAFVGFVAVVVGVERFTHTRTTHSWRRLVARWTGRRAAE